MKQNRHLQMLVAVILLLTGCAKNNTETDDETSVPLTIEASLTPELPQPATRADGISSENAQVGVFLTDKDDHTPQYNKKYTYSTNTGWSADNEPIYVDHRPAKVVAYYDPNKGVTFQANSTLTNANALTAQKYDESKIWYYDDTQQAVTNKKPLIAFKMKPAYASILISAVRDVTYEEGEGRTCAITEVTIATNGTQAYQQRAFDLSTGKPAQGSLTSATTIQVDKPGIDIGETTEIRLLMPPQDIENKGLTLSITVDGKKKTVLIPAKDFNNKMEQAIQYTVKLRIMLVAILLMKDAVTIEDWAAIPGGSSSGSIEEVIPQ